MKNQGLLKKHLAPHEWLLGINSPIKQTLLVENGDWSDYLPIKEPQQWFNLQTMGCVSFSALNCLEIIFKKQYNLDYNFSDRVLAKRSGTTIHGNWQHKVAETIRKQGICEEKIWPYPLGENTEYTWQEYYTDIPKHIINECNKFGDQYYINHEWVHCNQWGEALKYSPLQVTVTAWKRNGDLYYNNSKDDQNHAVTLFKIDDDFYIFDHIKPYIKRLRDDYNFGKYAKKFVINNIMSEFIPEDNILYQLVEGRGGFALGLDSRLIVDDLDKILASFMVRNNGKIEGKTRTLTQEQWLKPDHINLKGDILIK